MFKQLIIARRDLNMSPGKLAAQVSHASIAFLLEKLYWGSKEVISYRNETYSIIGYMRSLWRIISNLQSRR